MEFNIEISVGILYKYICLIVNITEDSARYFAGWRMRVWSLAISNSCKVLNINE